MVLIFPVSYEIDAAAAAAAKHLPQHNIGVLKSYIYNYVAWI